LSAENMNGRGTRSILPLEGGLCWVKYSKLGCYWPCQYVGLEDTMCKGKKTTWCRVLSYPVRRDEYDLINAKCIRFSFMAWLADFSEDKPPEYSSHFNDYAKGVEEAVQLELLRLGADQIALDAASRKRGYTTRINDYSRLAQGLQIPPQEWQKHKGSFVARSPGSSGLTVDSTPVVSSGASPEAAAAPSEAAPAATKPPVPSEKKARAESHSPPKTLGGNKASDIASSRVVPVVTKKRARLATPPPRLDGPAAAAPAHKKPAASSRSIKALPPPACGPPHQAKKSAVTTPVAPVGPGAVGLSVLCEKGDCSGTALATVIGVLEPPADSDSDSDSDDDSDDGPPSGVARAPPEPRYLYRLRFEGAGAEELKMWTLAQLREAARLAQARRQGGVEAEKKGGAKRGATVPSWHRRTMAEAQADRAAAARPLGVAFHIKGGALGRKVAVPKKMPPPGPRVDH